MNPFQTEVPGKWVLLGEHSVLHGEPAIVFPHPAFSLKLSFTPDRTGKGGLKIHPKEIAALIEELLHAALPRIEQDQLNGEIHIQSTIPGGAGLGSSAAISVALARFALHLQGKTGEPDQQELLRLATKLEDRFHGKSSGMDVAAVALGVPIFFKTGSTPIPLGLSRIPKFTLHDTGGRTQTRAMVSRVEEKQRSDSHRFEKLDLEHGMAVKRAREALVQYSRGEDEAVKTLAEQIKVGRDIFEQWGLIPPEILGLEESLRKEGAIATKLTGAGGGGFLIALWPREVL